MSGSGNDFIMLDNRDGQFDGLDKSLLSRYLARRKISIGADGVIFIESASIADYRMNYFNSDGSWAEICGNGARCTAYVIAGWTGLNEMNIETGAGIIHAEVDGNSISIGMPAGKLVEPNIELSIDKLPVLCDYYDTGVPHAVTIVDNLDEIPVERWGREIRYHRRFMPDGANVDFVQVLDSHRLAIRTYERGVEGETMACGTGVIASAISAARKKLVEPPVEIEALLPDTLTVDFEMQSSGSAENIIFSGEVTPCFKGEIEIPDELRKK